MKSPDEIKNGVECCIDGFCSMKCPNYHDLYPDCMAELKKALFAYIHQLEAERDAAVADILYAASVYLGECNTCKNGEVCAACKRQDACDECPNSKCMCSGCGVGRSNWKWRGVQKED